MHVAQAVASLPVLREAAADSFEGARFLERHADVACDGESLGVPVAGLRRGRGTRGQLALYLAKVADGGRFGEPTARTPRVRQCLLPAGHQGGIIAGELLDHAKRTAMPRSLAGAGPSPGRACHRPSGPPSGQSRAARPIAASRRGPAESRRGRQEFAQHAGFARWKNCPSGKYDAKTCAACTAKAVLPTPAIPPMA